MENIKILIDNYLPEGYTLTKDSRPCELILSPKGINYDFYYEADFKTEVEYDPHEDDDFLRGKTELQKKLVDGSISNIEEGFLSIDCINLISKLTKAYYKSAKDEKNKRKSYTYEVIIEDLVLNFENKEKQTEVYEIIYKWFIENK